MRWSKSLSLVCACTSVLISKYSLKWKLWCLAYTPPKIKSNVGFGVERVKVISEQRPIRNKYEYHQQDHGGCVKNPSGEKLPHVRPIAAQLIPSVESLAFGQFG
jgi:hypothetical protein